MTELIIEKAHTQIFTIKHTAAFDPDVLKFGESFLFVYAEAAQNLVFFSPCLEIMMYKTKMGTEPVRCGKIIMPCDEAFVGPNFFISLWVMQGYRRIHEVILDVNNQTAACAPQKYFARVLSVAHACLYASQLTTFVPLPGPLFLHVFLTITKFSQNLFSTPPSSP